MRRPDSVIRFLLCLAASFAGTPIQGRQAPAPPPAQWIEVPLAEHAFQEQPAGFRQETLDVTIAPGPGLEVDLGLKRGAALVYTWRVTQPVGGSVVSEFHGHTERVAGQPGTLMFYRKANGPSESGSLVAPFDGVHAWYFRNDAKTPVVVRLTLAGFYELRSKSDAIVAVP